MTQDDKLLLLKDLSARLPYGVKIHHGIPTLLISIKSDRDGMKIITEGSYGEHIFDIEDMKPYLRPMSSMTEDEANELDVISDGKLIGGCEYLGVLSQHYWTDSFKYILLGIDWLNAHHFDFRNLIEKGLALEALEGMYKTWNSLRGNLKEDNQGNIVGGLKL